MKFGIILSSRGDLARYDNIAPSPRKLMNTAKRSRCFQTTSSCRVDLTVSLLPAPFGVLPFSPAIQSGQSAAKAKNGDSCRQSNSRRGVQYSERQVAKAAIQQEDGQMEPQYRRIRFSPFRPGQEER